MTDRNGVIDQARIDHMMLQHASDDALAAANAYYDEHETDDDWANGKHRVWEAMCRISDVLQAAANQASDEYKRLIDAVTESITKGHHEPPRYHRF